MLFVKRCSRLQLQVQLVYFRFTVKCKRVKKKNKMKAWIDAEERSWFLRICPMIHQRLFWCSRVRRRVLATDWWEDKKDGPHVACSSESALQWPGSGATAAVPAHTISRPIRSRDSAASKSIKWPIQTKQRQTPSSVNLRSWVLSLSDLK